MRDKAWPGSQTRAVEAPPSLEEVGKTLAHKEPRIIPAEEDWRQAAVAAIFRQGAHGAELLFIQRARHPEDPWSGQLGFPGGRVEEDDDSPLAAARRETFEEIGLDLSESVGVRCVGLLHQIQARARQKILPMVISPFAYLHEGAEQGRGSLDLNHEVEAAFWVPLSELAAPHLRIWHESARSETPFRFRALDLGRSVPLWGITHRMTMEILGRLSMIEDVDDLTLPQRKS